MTVRSRSARDIAPPRPAPPSAPAKPRARAGKGANLLFLALAVLGSLHVGAMFGVEIWRAATGRQEIMRLSADVAALEQERGELLAVTQHAGDAQYREQLARCLGFVMPGETRYLTMTELAEPRPSGDWCR